MATWDLTSARLRELLTYCPETGVFTWNMTRRTQLAGAVAGCRDMNLGYWRLTIDNQTHYGHRVAWLYMTGELPRFQVDHIDGNRANNAWANLRSGADGVNRRNRREHNPEANKIAARAVIGGRGRYLGSFDTKEDADRARVEAKEAALSK